MAILITLNTGDVTNNGITYNRFYLKMTFLITVNKNINVKSHLLMLKVKLLYV